MTFKQHFIKEVIIEGFILLLLFLLIRALIIPVINKDSLFFPNLYSPYTSSKIFFISVSIKGVFEYFIYEKYPKNFFSSRVMSLLVMLLASILFYSLFYYFTNSMSIAVYIIFIVIYPILIGHLVSFYIQRGTNLRWNFQVASINYFIITIILMIGTYLPQTGFLFESLI